MAAQEDPKITLSFYGQDVSVGDGVWFITVNKIYYDPGWPRAIGLNSELIDRAIKDQVTLYVTNKKVGKIIIYPEDWKKKSWIHAFVKNGKIIRFYMYPLPPATPANKPSKE